MKALALSWRLARLASRGLAGLLGVAMILIAALIIAVGFDAALADWSRSGRPAVLELPPGYTPPVPPERTDMVLIVALLLALVGLLVSCGTRVLLAVVLPNDQYRAWFVVGSLICFGLMAVTVTATAIRDGILVGVDRDDLYRLLRTFFVWLVCLAPAAIEAIRSRRSRHREHRDRLEL